jgi:hypothetical protein
MSVDLDGLAGMAFASPAFLFLLFLETVKLIIMINDKMPFRAGVAGGTLLNVVFTFDFGHLLSSAILAAIGTLVSYVVTRILKALFEKEPAP